MSPITTFFKKKGIESEDELNTEEKLELSRWKDILAKEHVDVKDILIFCQSQRELLEDKLGRTDITDDERARVALLFTVYGKITALIESPQVQREALIKYIESLPDTTK